MKKLLSLINVSLRISLVSLFILGAWALAQRSDTALGSSYNSPATHAQVFFNEKALEANYQFLYDYNVNTTHGFSASASLAADRQYLLALDVTGDETGCLASQTQLSLRDCLTAVYHARLVNAYTLGRLR